jgi:small subunit ribosomal protein S24e
VIEIFHPGRANIPKVELAEAVGKKFKTSAECIVLYGFKTKFGGGKSNGFCLIYDNEHMKKKYESIPRLRKVCKN